MSYYDNDASWSAPVRQPSWENPPPPSRSGTGSSMQQQSELNAFASQFEEIDRATDNLMRSGKWFPGAMPAPPGGMPIRRDNMSQRGGSEYGAGADPRMGGAGPAGSQARQGSGSEYDGGRPGSAGLQGYYQGQRFPGGRQSEAEQMLQAKRRMAAQRERELRNYHQEQQYNRTVSGGKSDRSMSPNTMSEDDRRELIARQHRALYGDNSSMYGSDGSSSRPQSQDVRQGTSGRGASPLAFDPYGVQSPQNADGAVQMPPRDRGNSTASPVSNQQQAPQPSYSLLSDAQQSQNARTSNSSPTESPPPGQQAQKPGVSGVAPIGTRPAQQAGPSAGGLNKRSTTPLTPSSLSYGFSAEQGSGKDERSTSAASNPQSAAPEKAPGVGGLGGWSNSGAWGSAGKGLAVQQPSVWG